MTPTVSQQWKSGDRDGAGDSGLDRAGVKEAGGSEPARQAGFREGIQNANQEPGKRHTHNG